MALQWLTLIASMWLQSINGTNTNFPAYSSELKRILSISQIKLNNLASASDFGKLLGWIPGIAAAYLPLWLVLIIGALLGQIGYGLQYLFLTKQIGTLSYIQIFFLTVLAGNSICWINTVCNIVAIRNFPYDRQIAVGLSTSYIGLSAKLYMDLVDVVQTSGEDRAKLFLLVNSTLPLLVCVIAAPLTADFDFGKSRIFSGGFGAMFVITIFTGLFAVITSLSSMIPKFSPSMILTGIFTFLLMPLLIPLVDKLMGKFLHNCSNDVHEDIEKGKNNNVHEPDFVDITNGVSFEEIGPKVMLRRIEFWLYFFVYFFGATLGLVYLNNLGQIAESRGCSQTASVVSLSSAFCFYGRLVPSVLDYFASRKKWVVSKGAVIGSMMAPMCGAFFFLINKGDISLYLSTAIISICTGAITTISVSTTSELFGIKNFGVNHNILISNIPIGSCLFGNLAALIYDRERSLGEETCMGGQCYKTTFIMWGSLCVLGTLLAYILHRRTREVHSQG